MASGKTYRSTVKVPVYTSWKCEKCGETNFAAGSIICVREVFTNSIRPSKQDAAKEEAERKAVEEWQDEALKIISTPNQSAKEMFDGFYLENARCTKCKHIPRWYKHDMKFVPLLLVVALISGITAFQAMTSIVAWLIFIASAGGVLWSVIRKSLYKSDMLKLSKEYSPVIGSLNENLIDHAAACGKTIPSPNESIAIVMGYGNTESTSHSEVSNPMMQINFCRKCGAKLENGVDSCCICGTEVVKQ